MGTFLAFMGLLGSLITGIISYKQSQDISNQNVDLQQQTNEKNEQLMRESWERDDNAIQRSKADALAAGFSPLVGVNGASNSGPVTLSAPQATVPSMSGLSNFFNQMSSAGQARLARDQMDPIYKAQAEQMDIDNDSRRMSNILSIVKATKEIEGLDLSNTRLEEEIKSMLGDMLANEVISADDLKGTRWDGVAANKSIDRDFKVRETANANSAISNSNTAEANRLRALEIQNQENERQWQHDASTNAHTDESIVKFSYMGQEFTYRTTDTTAGRYVPVISGVDDKSLGQTRTVNLDGFPGEFVNVNGMDLKFYGSMQVFPVYKSKNSDHYFVLRPTVDGQSFTEITGDVTTLVTQMSLRDYGSSTPTRKIPLQGQYSALLQAVHNK